MGFWNIGSGISLKTEMTSKSKELFFGVFFMFRLTEGGRPEQPLIGYIYKMSRKEKIKRIQFKQWIMQINYILYL